MLSRAQAEALANLVHLLRPEWDRAGIFKALGHCKDRNELDVSMAAIRAAASTEMRNPGGIPGGGDHWHERVSPSIAPRPPKPGEACTTCGAHFHHCRCEGGPTIRVNMPAPDAAARKARLAEIAAARRAELCACGVPTTNCLTHKPAPTEETA